MKKHNVLFVSLLLVSLSFGGCKKAEETPRLVGAPGNPRFNLKFTNEENVDLDLHVKDSNGETIYFGNTKANRSPGELDVDCLCGDCPNGPNENIFWTPGSAPRGTYQVWIEYFGNCGAAGATSDFTLYVTVNERILETYRGTLSSTTRKSTVFTHQQD